MMSLYQIGGIAMHWWIIATICAFFVKGLCGFANTLVFYDNLKFWKQQH